MKKDTKNRGRKYNRMLKNIHFASPNTLDIHAAETSTERCELPQFSLLFRVPYVLHTNKTSKTPHYEDYGQSDQEGCTPTKHVAIKSI